MTKQSPSGGGQPQCVAFTQNSRDEVRQIDGDGQIVGALSAEAGMHQTNYLAFANHARDGFKVPEVMKDGVTPALTNPGNGGRADAVNVATHMQVRRLTPTECCRLQGFPDDHCDVTFRKKPAADGPKYRALGNSMAVPCMAWLGYRIHLATHRDTE
jgi:DNA (cytosine-5)-methyltransferase 1